MASGSNVFPQQTPNQFTGAQNGAATGSIKWSCHNCTFDNTGQRDKCEMCEALNPRVTAALPPNPPATQRPLTPQPPPNPPSDTPPRPSSEGIGDTVKNFFGDLVDVGVGTLKLDLPSKPDAPASSNDPRPAQAKKPQDSPPKYGEQRLNSQLAPLPPASTKPSNQRPSSQRLKAKDKTAPRSNSQTNTKPPTASSTGPSTTATASPKTTSNVSQSQPATSASVTKKKPAPLSSNSTSSASGSPSKFGRKFSISSEELRRKEELDAQTDLDAILAGCVQNNMSFVDPSFPPNERSLYGPRGRNHVTYTFDPFLGPVPGATAAAENLPVAWLRPQQIAPTDKDWALAFHNWVLFRDPRPGDITQGLLGICKHVL